MFTGAFEPILNSTIYQTYEIPEKDMSGDEFA